MQTTIPAEATDAALEQLAQAEPEAPAHGRPGERVTIGDGIPARVTSIQLRCNADDQLYVSAVECSWFDGCSRRCEWLEPWEVSRVGPVAAPIGFAARNGD